MRSGIPELGEAMEKEQSLSAPSHHIVALDTIDLDIMILERGDCMHAILLAMHRA